MKKGSKVLSQLIEDYPDHVSSLKQLREFVPPREERAKTHYLYGRTAVGKTWNTLCALRDLNCSFYKKPPGDQWFDGYEGQDIILLEEFHTCFKACQFKTLCDPLPPKQPIKGGFTSLQNTHQGS